MNKITLICSLFLSTLLFFSCEIQTDFKLQEGDLLFQDSDCGPFCDAIEAVTQSVDNYNFSHVGLVMKDENGDLKVMEAISAGVVLTSLDSFLNRSFDAHNKPKVLVGRLKPKYKALIPDAIAFIHSKMNAQYDAVFDINNDRYYCSELIHLAFKAANHNTPIFKEQPMTFKAPDTKETYKIWEDYFKDLGQPIPEGEPGLNPGGMSQSPFIDIVHHFGEPSKTLF
ncbi:YiiX/YebB-like N1pC/P60 family cysteine hydrolase [Formosa haliotis]|uniref:YiiX/YebB-like N1pC/P60 family cysteine hydrolase n=1 Tax=Formosa haliotis TaxID=1555194 RepID=UPI000825FCDF|nr:YiiX/YebB-like N1pC/P60 family cysteine hydrolase [Formosa haliotis]